MANVVSEARVSRTQLAGLLAVLVQMNGNSREEVESVARQISRALFEGAEVCQKAKRYDQADLFFDEAEVASRILEGCELQPC